MHTKQTSAVKKTFVCPTCKQTKRESQRVSGDRLLHAVLERMQADFPDWDGRTTCRADVHKYRIVLMRESIESQHGAVGNLDASVLERMEKKQLVSRKLESRQPDLGARVADAVATFGGSWRFLGIFSIVIAAWMTTNVILVTRAFDPYPFILLNLVLSCLAAVQAPVIMMSQNRHATRDRERAEHDYEVNLRAELEVELLHEKLDHLLLVEWQRLLEIQAIQTEMLEEILSRNISKK